VDPGAQHGNHRDDGEEDAGKELGHLLHRPPAELVGLVHRMRRDGHGDHRHGHHAHVAHQRGQIHHGARDLRPDIRLPHATEQHQAHDHGQQDEVELAVEPQAPTTRVGRGVGPVDLARLAEVPAVEREEQRQQHRDEEQRLEDHVLRGPEKRHALQKAEEQRRIAQRRERTAGIGHDEDEEDHHVRHMLAVVVGADQGANQQHRRTRRPHEAREHRAHGENARVEHGRAAQIAADVDAARHREQRREQDHEREVFGHQRMHQSLPRAGPAKAQPERNEERQRPAGRDLAVVVMPDHGRKHGQHRDREQHARERHAPPRRQLAAIDLGRTGHQGQQPQQRQGAQTPRLHPSHLPPPCP